MDYQTIRINAFEDYPSDLTLTSADIADSLPGNPVLNVIELCLQRPNHLTMSMQLLLKMSPQGWTWKR